MELTACGVALVGNLAYVASWESGFLSTIEIVHFSNLAPPVLVSSYDTPGYVQSLTVRDGIAYVADVPGSQDIREMRFPMKNAAGLYRLVQP